MIKTSGNYVNSLEYSAGQPNSTIFGVVLTVVFVQFYPHHCVQNDEISLKTHFGVVLNFLRVANFLAQISVPNLANPQFGQLRAASCI